MRVVILANGDPPSYEIAREVVERNDLLIAVDGAAHIAAAIGLRPALVCGDFDSMDLDVARGEFPDAEFVETTDQNLADLEKALLLAMERGATEITFLGTGGGRVDHTLTTIALLLRYHGEVNLTLLHDGSAIHAVSGSAGAPGELRLGTREGDTVSLITFSPENRVSLTGTAWPLHHARLSVGTQGVSNVAQGPEVIVEVTEGEVVVCHLWEI